MEKLSIRDVDCQNKRVLMRADFNVPLDDQGRITDDRRIRAALPTIQHILRQNPKKLILMSHLGRPKGKVVESLRLRPVGKRLQELLGEEVLIVNDCVGPEVEQAVNQDQPRIVLLENLRFHKEETDNDPEFAKKLASWGDLFVNDAFGTAHRAHASTVGVTQYLTSVAGLLLEKEILYLGKAVSQPDKPFVVILGGAKVSDKILLIENLLDKADTIVIAGGMAYTFLKALGKEIGNSLLEEDRIPTALEILNKAKEKGVEILLSRDFGVVEAFDKPHTFRYVKEIPPGWEAVDIGPETCEDIKKVLSRAKTLVWNGPVGVFEVDAYAQGTKALAEYVASLKGLTSIIGGGDTAAAVAKFHCEEGITHISTGGGASLEFLEGKTLPGIAALTDKAAAVKN